jgi:hypothetical protein
MTSLAFPASGGAQSRKSSVTTASAAFGTEPAGICHGRRANPFTIYPMTCWLNLLDCLPLFILPLLQAKRPASSNVSLGLRGKRF